MFPNIYIELYWRLSWLASSLPRESDLSRVHTILHVTAQQFQKEFQKLNKE